jgi:hypothetical protein
MAWTNPRTWIAGEVVTASIGNTHWRDEFNYLYTDISGSYARVYNNAALAIPTATATTLTFNSELDDTASYHSASSSDFHKLTVPSTGRYRVGVSVSFAVNTVGARSVNIYANGTSIVAQDTRPPAAVFETAISFSAEYTMTAVGYFNATVFQSSSSDLNVTVSTGFGIYPSFWISRIA